MAAPKPPSRSSSERCGSIRGTPWSTTAQRRFTVRPAVQFSYRGAIRHTSPSRSSVTT
jgi:hypothetical protein